MLFQSHFAIDLFNKTHAKDPVGLIDAYRQRAAQELGMSIISHFPYRKDEENSWQGDVPALAMSKDHPYVDRYVAELVVIDRATFAKVIHLLLKPQPDISQAIKLIADERIPLGSDRPGSDLHPGINKPTA